jgi:DNA repair photolyase
LKLTRGCLEALAEFRNPVSIVTKNALITRDIDVLSELARHHAVRVHISLTTLDTELRKVMEPRTSPPMARLAAVEKLAQAGVPVGVLLAPMIPGLNDHEIASLIEAAAKAGARSAGYVPLRLPHSVASLFEEWLRKNFPAREQKVLNGVRALHDGKLRGSGFGNRMSGRGIFADQMEALFNAACRKHGINTDESKDLSVSELSIAAFRRPGGIQMDLGV